MKSSIMTRSKGQVYSVGNYLMAGKVLGKGHFARVEEATHRIVGKKVAIKVIDLTYIKEEYARRNLHREPKVMSRLRHPCIAALFETMMHGPRLYVVMEAACGGDLCALVLNTARGAIRGLGEPRAKFLAAQLVSATRHMHARGVVHRDLKMENIMLDATKQFIKIVDFGLSNLWVAGGGLRTPCGSLEYAAPELFVDGRRYGPEVDLWSIGVIVYGMVTGSLPFGGAGAGNAAEAGAGAGEPRSRPQLRAAISRGFGRKHRVALHAVSPECRTFIQQLLEPNVDNRLKTEEAARHRWIRKPGMRMKTHPLDNVDPKMTREIYRQISELSGQTIMEVVSQIKADPYGAMGGMFNVKAHQAQLHAMSSDALWCNNAVINGQRPASPPTYISRSTTTMSPATSPSPALSPAMPPARAVSYTTCAGAGAGTGDGARLPSIAEHGRDPLPRPRPVTRPTTEERRPEFYRRAGDGPPSWRPSGASVPATPPPRILLHSHATTLKRASLGSIVSPHSSTNSQCKSERASLPVKWYSTRSTTKELTPLQRLRRTAPIK